MKQRFYWPAALLLCGIASVTLLSCKKDDNQPATGTAARIIGNWRESYRAADSNANGSPDSNERVRTGYFRLVSFYPDGRVHDTMFVNGVATSTDATYTVTADYLSIAFPGLAPNRILQLDASTLLLRDTTQRPAIITAFDKQ